MGQTFQILFLLFWWLKTWKYGVIKVVWLTILALCNGCLQKDSPVEVAGRYYLKSSKKVLESYIGSSEVMYLKHCFYLPCFLIFVPPAVRFAMYLLRCVYLNMWLLGLSKSWMVEACNQCNPFYMFETKQQHCSVMKKILWCFIGVDLL